jgi:membrane-associated protease RseP (regulator of RpoE activity)
MRRLPPLAVALLLFLATAITTTLAHGPLYSAAILAILGAHEMGHYLMCRRHGVDATYPIFLPFFPVAFGPGTLGAVIRIRSRFPDRRALFDIGAAGPLAGLAVALPVTLIGVALSGYATAAPPNPAWPSLGRSLLFEGFIALVQGPRPAGQYFFLHPLAIAGWFGLFVTGLNLLPIGQLDGGHVVYALLGRSAARRVTLLGLGGFAAVTLLVYNYWFLFLALVATIGRRHPPTIDDDTPLDRGRVALAVLTLAFFVVTFVPVPVVGMPAMWSALRAFR